MDQSFCEVENVDPAQHQRWLDKHQFKPEEDGTFRVDSFEGKMPVEESQLFENIKTNISNNNFDPLHLQPYDERTFVMCCGGPSLSHHLDEVKAKSLDPEHYLVVCSNMTGGYLLENGITAHAQFILDPQEKKKLDIAPGKTFKDTEYWLNVACHPAVFQALLDQGIKPKGFLASFEKDGVAAKTVKESMVAGQSGMMVIQGGTMAGLRAMNLADALGFRKIEYYGFDATVEIKDGKARPYAYEKKRGEAIIEVFCDRCDARFDTTLIFQRQVNEFLEWAHNLRWIDFKIIGGGLIAHSYAHAQEVKAKVYHSLNRYTPEYMALQKELHAQGSYGVSGAEFNPSIFHAIAQLSKRYGDITVLDYGSAGGKTIKAVRDKMWLPPGVTDYCYDPFVDEYAREPEPADLVVCTDVLEHVEPQCTRAVLDHLAQLTRHLIFLSIALTPATKRLSDGRNAHINLRDSEAWLCDLKSRFIVSEVKLTQDGDCLLVVGQNIEDVRHEMRRRKAA